MNRDCITLKMDESYYRIDCEDITHITAFGSKVTVYMHYSNPFSLTGNLKLIYNMLPGQFGYINSDTIVNVNKVTSFSPQNGELKLEPSYLFQVSSERLNDIEDLLYKKTEIAQ